MAETRYLTLVAARALDCNGCGDCCDSRRTPDWAWGALPASQFAELNGGAPLLIPVERMEATGEWRDRAHEPYDALELIPTRFRCAAFQPHEDGSGGCGLHDSPRPAPCGEFPVGGADLDREVAEFGEAKLNTSWFPRCTWYGMTVVADDDPRAERAS